MMFLPRVRWHRVCPHPGWAGTRVGVRQVITSILNFPQDHISGQSAKVNSSDVFQYKMCGFSNVINEEVGKVRRTAQHQPWGSEWGPFLNKGWEKSGAVGIALFVNMEPESTDGPILPSATELLCI